MWIMLEDRFHWPSGVLYFSTDLLITVSNSSDASDTVLFHVIYRCTHALFIPGTEIIVQNNLHNTISTKGSSLYALIQCFF